MGVRISGKVTGTDGASKAEEVSNYTDVTCFDIDYTATDGDRIADIS